MTPLPAEAWFCDEDVETLARALWEDAVTTGELRDLTPTSWERNKSEFRRKALVGIRALSGRTP